MRRILVIAAALAAAACDGPRPPAQPVTPPPAPSAPTPPAPPPAPPRPAAVDAFDAVGTEPFWALSVRPEWITFSGLDRTTLSWPNPGVRWQGRRRTWTARSVAGEISVAIEPGDCSDGMSDRTYPYAAEVRLGAEVLKGCASKAAP